MCHAAGCMDQGAAFFLKGLSHTLEKQYPNAERFLGEGKAVSCVIGEWGRGWVAFSHTISGQSSSSQMQQRFLIVGCLVFVDMTIISQGLQACEDHNGRGGGVESMCCWRYPPPSPACGQEACLTLPSYSSSCCCRHVLAGPMGVWADGCCVKLC